MTLAIAVAAGLFLGGCSTTMPTARTRPAEADRTTPTASPRCSDGDPDRSAWFCVLGRTLYSTAAGVQSDTVRRK